MTAQTITIAGARGGSSTATVTAMTAVLLAGHAVTELVAAERDATAALLGLTGPHDSCAPIQVLGRLRLVSTSSGTAEMAVIDAQRLDWLDTRPGGLFVVVLRPVLSRSALDHDLRCTSGRHRVARGARTQPDSA